MRSENEIRRRPRKWFISFIALISALAVIGGFLLSNTNTNKSNTVAQRSGAVTLTADQLVNLIKKEKLIAYWLGPISGSKYTLVASGNGVVTVTYLSGEIWHR